MASVLYAIGLLLLCSGFGLLYLPWQYNGTPVGLLPMLLGCAVLLLGGVQSLYEFEQFHAVHRKRIAEEGAKCLRD